MDSGRKLDVLIAEKVFGHTVVHKTWAKGKCESYTIGEPDYHDSYGAMVLNNSVPSYSENIQFAWEVADYLLKDAWSIQIEGSEHIGRDMGGFDVRFNCKCGARGRFEASAETLPHAICLTALKAVKNEPR